MSEAVVIPGARDVRGSLDAPDQESASADSQACVVACPPHPQLGGSRSDRRLTAVADALTERGIGCLRFDYGPWDEGPGELRDARNSLEWARERYHAVGLFGYSFGGCLALVAAAAESDLAAVSALAPAPRIGEDIDAAAAVEEIDSPCQVVYGERDDTVDSRPVVARAEERGFAVTKLATDHHFVGQSETVGSVVADFLADEL
ncbi:dienelactone hydrolase family protein [Halosimplex amylolyticum]|uniref:dienelactone hydrolase family protein n=1 Tax=Halosimplex amylolyticum TaxID=3396616 RepID=UPI003F5672EC